MKPNLRIEVFSQDNCAGCEQVKALLTAKKLPFVEYNLTKDPNNKQLLFNRVPGVRTIPQVFFNNILIGGLQQVKQELNTGDYS